MCGSIDATTVEPGARPTSTWNSMNTPITAVYDMDPDSQSVVDAVADNLWNATGAFLTVGDLWADYETSVDTQDLSLSTITLPPLTKATLSFEHNISDPYLIEKQIAAAQAPQSTTPGPVTLRGNAVWQQDVLNSPLHNGILLPDNVSAVQLSPVAIGGAFSLRLVFSPQRDFGAGVDTPGSGAVTTIGNTTQKIDSNTTIFNLNTSSIINSTIFWCGSSSSSSSEVISLVVSERVFVSSSTNITTNIVRLSNETNITTSTSTVLSNIRASTVMFRLEIRRANVVSALESTLIDIRSTQTNTSLGWYDLILSVDSTGAATIHNHGLLIAQGSVFTPYIIYRDVCVLGTPSAAGVTPISTAGFIATNTPTDTTVEALSLSTSNPASGIKRLLGLSFAVSLLELVDHSMMSSDMVLTHIVLCHCCCLVSAHPPHTPCTFIC